MIAAGATKHFESEVQAATVQLARTSPISVIFESLQGECNILSSAVRVKGEPCKGSSLCAK